MHYQELNCVNYCGQYLFYTIYTYVCVKYKNVVYKTVRLSKIVISKIKKKIF